MKKRTLSFEEKVDRSVVKARKELVAYLSSRKNVEVEFEFGEEETIEGNKRQRSKWLKEDLELLRKHIQWRSEAELFWNIDTSRFGFGSIEKFVYAKLYLIYRREGTELLRQLANSEMKYRRPE